MGTNLSDASAYWMADKSSIEHVPTKLKLNKLDFAKGVRSNELNENFELIKYWIEAERLRIGGWGIVEGFELTKNLANFTINVGPGIIINQHGEEIHVPETNPSLFAGPPVYETLVETHTVDENGLLKLNFAMYSNHNHHTVKYVPPVDVPEGIEEEFTITVTETGAKLNLFRDVQCIIENLIVLPEYAGQEVTVEYMYANDRIDGIFLRKDGQQYEYELGIISTSPSEQVVQEYFDRGYYLIGFAYWHIGLEVDVEFLTGDRTLRKVFVDENNVLYLNGKPYVEKEVIYFREPKPAKENDLWYNVEEEVLYIWRPNEDGTYGWQIINDLSRTLVSVHQFSIDENPQDLQTFSFEAYPELSFIPGHHQLEVFVDQIAIMDDQIEELYPEDGEGLASGQGFRFKYPLERASIVEVRVTHNINIHRKKIDLFPHESFFGAGGYYTLTDADVSRKIFSVLCQYQCYLNQIEVYRNGLRLIEGKDYKGVLLDGTVAEIENKDMLCDKFKITSTIAKNDVICYRVLRPVASYTNLKSIIVQYEDIAEQCLDQTSSLATRIDTLSANVNRTLQEHGTMLNSHASSISSLQSGKMNTDVQISKANLASQIYDGVIKEKRNFIKNIDDAVVFVQELSVNDYITVGYKTSNSNTLLLMEGADYEIQATTGGVNISLSSRWTGDATAKLYINALIIGV